MPMREIRSFRGSRAKGHGSRCGRRVSIGRNAARRWRFTLEVTTSRATETPRPCLLHPDDSRHEQRAQDPSEMIRAAVLLLCGLTVALAASLAALTENDFTADGRARPCGVRRARARGDELRRHCARRHRDERQRRWSSSRRSSCSASTRSSSVRSSSGASARFDCRRSCASARGRRLRSTRRLMRCRCSVRPSVFWSIDTSQSLGRPFSLIARDRARRCTYLLAARTARQHPGRI